MHNSDWRKCNIKIVSEVSKSRYSSECVQWGEHPTERNVGLVVSFFFKFSLRLLAVTDPVWWSWQEGIQLSFHFVGCFRRVDKPIGAGHSLSVCTACRSSYWITVKLGICGAHILLLASLFICLFIILTSVYLHIVDTEGYSCTWSQSLKHTHTQTPSRSPLDEGSVYHGDLYLATHNTHTHTHTLARSPLDEVLTCHRNLYLATHNTHAHTHTLARSPLDEG